MQAALPPFDHPIDAMYAIHEALRAEAAYAETLVRNLPVGDACEEFQQAFVRWAIALEYHAVTEDRYMTADVDRPVARTNEEEHQHLTVLLGDLQAFLPTLAAEGITARSRRHLLGKVVELRVAQDDHLEEEEERILPVLREYRSQAQQQEIAQHLLVDQASQNPGWVLAWLAPYITAEEHQRLTALTAQHATLPA